jgi:P-type Cu+ transporter
VVVIDVAQDCAFASDLECKEISEAGSMDNVTSKNQTKGRPNQDIVIDPVCGMSVEIQSSQFHVVRQGQTFHFCSKHCLKKFTADPVSHMSAEIHMGALAQTSTDSIFTCPMHPEIAQPAPGNCPICGMALEPKVATNDDEPNAELTLMSRRFWIGLVLTLPIFLLEMGGHLTGFVTHTNQQASNWVQLALATPVVWWAGWPIFVRGLKSLVSMNLNMFTLISIGTGISWTYSVVATVYPELFPNAFRQHDGSVAIYFESAAVITVLVLLGQVLELRARAKTSGAIKSLLRLSPKFASRIDAAGVELQTAIEEIIVGDKIRVRPGEKVPVDGELIEGRSSVDESMITGESMPVSKTLGSKLIAGTINASGSFVMSARRVGRDTMLAQIVQMVATAQRSKAPIQRLTDLVSSWFVPSVLFAALAAFVAWSIWGPEPRHVYGLIAAVSVLIIACPCALGLATPMSIMVGIGRGARSGILIKNAAALERFEKVDTLVFDKTGTLTEGRPAVTDIVSIARGKENEILAYAAAVEQASEHPLAKAICDAARANQLKTEKLSDFSSLPGLGAEATVGSKRIRVGNETYFAAKRISVGSLSALADEKRSIGATVIFIAVNTKAVGFFAISDPVKATSHGALNALRAEGIRLVMLTGDNRATAASIASSLGIAEVEADVLPDQKATFISKLMREGRVVAMAGDGVNDAPALASTDVGIAMGGGTDVAMQSAGITLLNGDLMGIVRARKLSKVTMRNIRQNLFFAFVYNAAGIPIAAGVLYPHFGILLSPIIAAAAMSLSSVSVIANAARLNAVGLGS